MKILSFNVNGIRAREKAGFVDAMKKIKPDILCLQEVRAHPEQMQANTRDYFEKDYGNWHQSEHSKAGYAGVLTAYKMDLTGIPVFSETAFNRGDETGREYILEFKNFVLINTYVPNSGRNLEKLEHRLKWERDLCDFVSFLKKPVIICGDMNVAPSKIDCNVFSKAGTSKEERGAFVELCGKNALVDVYRHFYPFKQEFTWYSNQYDSRTANKGMRIDHFLCSRELIPKIRTMGILQDAAAACGSDHCPIFLDIDI